jgi:hypothetical protein
LITTYQVEGLGVASIGIAPVLTDSQRLKEAVSCLSGIYKKGKIRFFKQILKLLRQIVDTR